MNTNLAIQDEINQESRAATFWGKVKEFFFEMIAGEPEIEPICYTRERKPIGYDGCTLWLQRRNRSELLGRITEFCGLSGSEEAEPDPDVLCVLKKRELRMLKRSEGKEKVYAVLFPTFGNDSLKQVFKARVRCEVAGECLPGEYICRVWFSNIQLSNWKG